MIVDEVTYTVFVKDTEGKFHVIETSTSGNQTIIVNPENQDYQIDTIYVQILNNSDENKEVSVAIKIEGSV